MKLKVQGIGMGLVNAQNNDIMLVGGMRSGNSSHDTTRRRYTIYDKRQWQSMAKEGVSDESIEKACNMGIVDLFVIDGQEESFGVKGLVNIEIKKEHRRKGIASKVVSAIRETTGQQLNVHDIKKHVSSVWRKLGVTEFHDGHGRPVQVSKVPASRNINGVMPPLDLTLENKSKNPTKASLDNDSSELGM